MIFYAFMYVFRFTETGRNERVICFGGRNEESFFLLVYLAGGVVEGKEKKDASMVHLLVVKFANFLFHLKKGSKCC